MKSAYLALILMIGVAFGDQSERADIRLVDGTVLKNARIISTSPNDAVVVHSDGIIQNIKWDQMPEDIRVKHDVSEESQKEFNEEHEERAAFNRKRSAVIQKIEKALSASIYVEVQVFQVVNKGILCRGMGYLNEVEGKRVTHSNHKRGWGLYPEENVTTRNVERYKTMPSFQLGKGELVFIECSTDTLYDGGNKSFFVLANGTYTYSTALTGASRTVQSYAEASVFLANHLSPEDLSLVSEGEIRAAMQRGVAKRR